MQLHDYYVYNLVDADGIVRYVGKGTGRRAYNHRGLVLALVSGALATRASKVHRRFAEEMRNGRDFRVVMVADGLSQAEAYATETRMIAMHRRETESGTLWNVLAGGEGFQGILRDDWILVARQAAATKALTGSGLRAGTKAAATKALIGSGRRAGAKAAATKAAKQPGPTLPMPLSPRSSAQNAKTSPEQAIGAGRLTGAAKAAATKALTGSGLLAGAKAAATKRAKLAALECLASAPALPM